MKWLTNFDIELINKFWRKRVLAKLEKVEETQRVILNGLKGAGYFHFDVPLIQKFACADQVDLEIVERVREAGLQVSFRRMWLRTCSNMTLRIMTLAGGVSG